MDINSFHFSYICSIIVILIAVIPETKVKQFAIDLGSKRQGWDLILALPPVPKVSLIRSPEAA